LRVLTLAVLAVLGTLLFVWPRVARAGRADAASDRPAATLNVIVIGDFYSYGYSTSQNPALRQSVPPTLQALNQIQAANSRIRIDVLFIPVADAIGGGLFTTSGPGAGAAQPAMVAALKNASIVVNGLAVGNSRFARSTRTVLFGGGASSKSLPDLMTVFDDGAYLRAEVTLPEPLLTTVNELAGRLGYIRVDEKWGAASRPGDLRQTATIRQRAEPLPSALAGIDPPGTLLVRERVKAGLRRLDERFANTWRSHREGSFLITVLAPASGDDAWWLIDLTAGTAASGTGPCTHDPRWSVTAPAAAGPTKPAAATRGIAVARAAGSAPAADCLPARRSGSAAQHCGAGRSAPG
jgi:hypothetical protein